MTFLVIYPAFLLSLTLMMLAWWLLLGPLSLNLTETSASVVLPNLK